MTKKTNAHYLNSLANSSVLRVSHYSLGDPELTPYLFLSTSHISSPHAVPRPKRVNRGQGGAIAQLSAVSDLIRPDLASQPSKNSKKARIPTGVAINAMAPAKQVGY
jgi:hypothetical protein